MRKGGVVTGKGESQGVMGVRREVFIKERICSGLGGGESQGACGVDKKVGCGLRGRKGSVPK